MGCSRITWKRRSSVFRSGFSAEPTISKGERPAIISNISTPRRRILSSSDRSILVVIYRVPTNPRWNCNPDCVAFPGPSNSVYHRMCLSVHRVWNRDLLCTCRNQLVWYARRHRVEHCLILNRGKSRRVRAESAMPEWSLRRRIYERGMRCDSLSCAHWSDSDARSLTEHWIREVSVVVAYDTSDLLRWRIQWRRTSATVFENTNATRRGRDGWSLFRRHSSRIGSNRCLHHRWQSTSWSLSSHRDALFDRCDADVVGGIRRGKLWHTNHVRSLSVIESLVN